MFENILGQPIIETIKNDLISGTLPPSILFSGEEATGKGSTALELARVLTCTASPEDGITKNTARWNCDCPSCARHKLLSNVDLVVTGPKNFLPEIKAAESVFLKNPKSAPHKLFFIRACKKLLLRFSPVLWEGDPKISKLNPLLGGTDKEAGGINQDLEDLINFNLDEDDKDEGKDDGEKPEKKGKRGEKGKDDGKENKQLEKLLESITEKAQKLESEGISDTIPVAHIRAASSWLRITPNGKRKILIIENSEKMNDSAKNSLLKTLEEPPEDAQIILTSTKPEILLPTILSRVRPYVFSKRGALIERNIITKIFRNDTISDSITGDNYRGNLITRYLDKFLPVQGETLYPVAAFFLASISAINTMRHRKGGAEYQLFVSTGEYCSAIAEKAGLPRYAKTIKEAVAETRKAAGKFEAKRLYGVFLEKLCTLFSESTASVATGALPAGTVIYYRNLLAKRIEESRIAVEIYNQQIEAALEHLAAGL